MKKIISALILSLSWVVASEAVVITSASDPVLTGAIVDDFSSYAAGNVASVSDGFFTMTQNGGGTLDVTDTYAGQYGSTGRSVVSYGRQGITIDFASAVSAFGIHIGGSDYDWTINAEAFGTNGNSLGSATVTHNQQGFFLGWADMNIGSIVLSPVVSDAVLFDNLHYVVADVPEPATLVLLGLGLAGLGLSRKKNA